MQCKTEELRLVRRDLQLIFQDPFSSLNPRMTIKNIIGEPLLVHNIAKGKEQEEEKGDGDEEDDGESLQALR